VRHFAGIRGRNADIAGESAIFAPFGTPLALLLGQWSEQDQLIFPVVLLAKEYLVMKRAFFGLVAIVALAALPAVASAHDPGNHGHGHGHGHWNGHGRDYDYGYGRSHAHGARYRGGWNQPSRYVARRPVVQPDCLYPRYRQPVTVLRPVDPYGLYGNGLFYNSPNSFFGIRF
jgi:hypothetical protein